MKKLILAAFALTTAASVFAQGTIIFNNAEATVRYQVYAPLATSGANMYVSQIGNSSSQVPAGTTVWTAYTLVGANGGLLAGPTTDAELLGAPGLSQSVQSLAPATAGGITVFKTGAAAGYITGTTPTFDNIPADSTAGATVEMVAWDDSSGDYTTWAAASAAWKLGEIAAGISGTENITANIGGTGTPPYLPTTMQSFNLYYIPVPEPATFALAGLGLATLLVFRRRS